MKQKIVTLIGLYLLLPLWSLFLPEQLQAKVMELFCPYLAAQSDTTPIVQEKLGFWAQLKAVLSKTNEKNGTPSVTEKYPLYYDWIHQKEKKFYDSVSQEGVASWDKYQGIITVKRERSEITPSSNKIAPNKKVFGWHPFWMGSAYQQYHFEFLSYLAWFSYSVDPFSGNYENPDVIDMWKKSGELFEMAQKSGCKVLLTITNHTRNGNKEFLSHPDRQDLLIDSLIALLQGRGAGVDVNFENIPNGFEEQMTFFLQKLSRRLKKENKDYILTVDLPIIDHNNTYLFKYLDDYVDLFIVTGYDFYNVLSQTDGPVAPLNAQLGELGIRQTVDKYLQKGLKKEKLLLGLPYYGGLWTAKSPGPGQRDTTLKFEKHLSYREIKRRYGNKTPNYDYNRWGAYYIFPATDSNYYEKCWFDDTITLGRKFDWVIEENLAGVGLWALGYDYNYPEFWNMLDKKFAADSLLVYSESFIESKQYKLGKSLMAYRSVIGIAGIFLAVFIISGLVVALFDWRVREVFFQNKTLRLLYSLAAAGIVLFVFAFYLFVREQPLLDSNNLFGVGIGLTAGICIAFVVRYFYEKWAKNLP